MGGEEVDGYSLSSFKVEGLEKKTESTYLVKCRIIADIYYKKEEKEEKEKTTERYGRRVITDDDSYIRDFDYGRGFSTATRDDGYFDLWSNWRRPSSTNFWLSLVVDVNAKTIQVWESPLLINEINIGQIGLDELG